MVKKNGRQQVSIRVANAHTENTMSIDHYHDFVMCCDDCTALGRQESYHVTAIPKAAKSQLADHARMAEQSIIFNNPAQLRVSRSEMINPDRSVS
ncbi:hypothetical protein GA0061101_109165 [Rhizobium lusitanum]|uniref:Uncharacterized protein n=1 Tax=Rhizobium lusitanum TaxID=293958 RepID=A0A1C3WB61_9HYPH|nr:hypothetical protein GA0061101_109165 [Rhizobium lusitanum]